jgi:hypothetical protein
MTPMETDETEHNSVKDGIKSSIIWYGERGLVNSMIYALTRGNQIQELLNKIHWADEKEKTWTNLLAETSIIIELGLNDFGNPDLIIKAKDHQGDPHFIFIEAKTGSYNENAAPNKKMTGGYNSTINGQLSLKYRFVKALETWDGETGIITESTPVYHAYRENIGDYSTQPRTLKNQAIIEDILKETGFTEANTGNSYYIALTLEEKGYNPFTDTENIEYRPVFLDEKGENQYTNLRANTGSINLAEVKEFINDPAFNKVYDLMTRRQETTPTGKHPQIRTTKLSNYPKQVIDKCRNIGEKLLETTNAETLDQKAGSFSLLDASGLVIGKIIPREDEIWYGVRETRHLEEPPYQRIGKRLIRNTAFIFYTIE